MSHPLHNSFDLPDEGNGNVVIYVEDANLLHVAFDQHDVLWGKNKALSGTIVHDTPKIPTSKVGSCNNRRRNP